jgi:DNA processing protein
LLSADRNAVAIVGARRCSEYGLKVAEKLAFDLASRGLTVISGMARGIDTAAHRGALKAKGRTVAVIGSGFRHVYPPGNKKLLSLIAEKGAVLTEHTSGTLPLKGNFPRRNRIISGMAQGVIVVEAARKSGAMITVDYALEQGREVFAVPGRIDAFASSGTNKLIQGGAKLVTCVEDVLEELNFDESAKPVPAAAEENREKFLTARQQKVLKAIRGEGSAHIDQIYNRTEIEFRHLSGVLLKLELNGFIEKLPGQRSYHAC